MGEGMTRDADTGLRRDVLDIFDRVAQHTANMDTIWYSSTETLAEYLDELLTVQSARIAELEAALQHAIGYVGVSRRGAKRSAAIDAVCRHARALLDQTEETRQ